MQAEWIVPINGNTMTIEKLYQLGYHGKLQIQNTQSITKSRQVIQNILKSKKIVYGINTGFGNFADTLISPQQTKQLQINLIRSHAAGVGKPLSPQRTRRLMALRLNTLSKGRSGITLKNLLKFVEAFNKNYLPMVPEQGTVGASGDLAPLSHLALGLIGEGLVYEQGKYVNAQQVCKKINLQRIELQQKQGLALINGTQLITSLSCQGIVLCKRILQVSDICVGFGYEIFGGNISVFNGEYINSLQSEHQKQSLKSIARYIEESDLYLDRYQKVGGYTTNQSIMNAPFINAALRKTIAYAYRIITQEINSATDNPLVMFKQDGLIQDGLVSGGNFHGQYPAKVADMLAISLHRIGMASQRRISKYVNQRVSGLPPFIIEKGGLNSGFMIAHCTAAALVSQNKSLVMPASVDSIQTSANQQDHVSMGGWAARKLLKMIENTEYILAIQLLSGAHAIDLLKMKCSRGLDKIHKNIRKQVQYFPQDEYMTQKIQKMRKFVSNPNLLLQ